MRQYPFPWDLFIALSRTLPSGYRSLAADSALLVSRIRPAPVVGGIEHIPRQGPLIIACNHYQRRGLWVGWPGSVATLAIAEQRGNDPPIHWLATGGLRVFQWRGDGPAIPLSGVLFRRVAGIYGMTALPLTDARKRAGAVRSWLHWCDRGEVIGLFPEGLAGRSDGVRQPDPGFGRLARRFGQIPTLPVGIHEADGTLHVQFGTPLRPLPEAQGEDIMRAIASLLPDSLRGAYRDQGAGIGALD